MTAPAPVNRLSREDILIALSALGEDPSASRVDQLRDLIDASTLPEGDRGEVVQAAVDEGRRQLEAGAAKSAIVVPSAVEHHVRFALNSLREQEAALHGVQLARGNGHILALERQDREPKIQHAMEMLDEFRHLAKKNGVDAEAFIQARGGVPDLGKYGYAAAPTVPVGEPAECEEPLVLDINGRRFAPAGTAADDLDGYYEQKPNGVLLRDLKKEPFAFIVGNKHNEYFFVSCSQTSEGIRYMFSTSSLDERRLGLDEVGYAAGKELAEKIVNQVRQHSRQANERESAAQQENATLSPDM